MVANRRLYSRMRCGKGYRDVHPRMLGKQSFDKLARQLAARSAPRRLWGHNLPKHRVRSLIPQMSAPRDRNPMSAPCSTSSLSALSAYGWGFQQYAMGRVQKLLGIVEVAGILDPCIRKAGHRSCLRFLSRPTRVQQQQDGKRRASGIDRLALESDSTRIKPFGGER